MKPEVDKIAIYVPDDEAKKFMLFQQYYDLFTLLLDKGVFEQKNAQVILNFDQYGDLQTIERSDFLWSARHDK